VGVLIIGLGFVRTFFLTSFFGSSDDLYPLTMSANSVSSTNEGREGAGAGEAVVLKKEFRRDERWLAMSLAGLLEPFGLKSIGFATDDFAGGGRFGLLSMIFGRKGSFFKIGLLGFFANGALVGLIGFLDN